jgi:WS/DGAT/MGAT family acyltransferase
MREMTGADAYFLYEESRARHMHTLKILVIEPGSAQPPLDFERFRAGAAVVMPQKLALRLRPLRIPLRLGHPMWLEAPRLDVHYHFQRIELPAPGGRGEFDAWLGRIASTPLDQGRPLWRLYFVEGLAGGRIAFVAKIHHAVADGGASAELIASTFATTTEPAPLPAAWSAPDETAPPPLALVAEALRRGLARQRQLPGLVLRSLRDTRRNLLRRRGDPALPGWFSCPMTRFNRPLTPNRVIAHATLRLSDLRALRRAFDCSTNEIYVSLVGGVLRRYLAARGELPARPLTAAIPASLRRPGDPPDFGNAVGVWYASTGSHLGDPAERLRHVAASSRASRAAFHERDATAVLDWLDYWPLRRLYLDGLPVLAKRLLHRPPVNVIVSNVAGPRTPLYAGADPVVAVRSMGPLPRHQGLNFTAWSYLDDFAIGIHACREHVPDVADLADAFEPELDALLAAAPSGGLKRPA